MIDRTGLKLQLIGCPMSVCQLSDRSQLPQQGDYVFTACTDEEISLVCPSSLVPEQTLTREDGWCMLRIAGILDFSLIGILADIAGILAEKRIPIFAISSYNTDYVMFREEYRDDALSALSGAGYGFQAQV